MLTGLFECCMCNSQTLASYLVALRRVPASWDDVILVVMAACPLTATARSVYVLVTLKCFLVYCVILHVYDVLIVLSFNFWSLYSRLYNFFGNGSHMSSERLTTEARGSWPLLKSWWRILAGTCDCSQTESCLVHWSQLQALVCAVAELEALYLVKPVNHL